MLISPSARALDMTPFDQGTAAFQKRDFKQARASFQEALKANPKNLTALYDLALTEQKDGNPGMALALWRKALVQSPGFTPARQALTWTSSHLEHGEIPHEVEIWESLHSAALSRFPIGLYLSLTAAFLLAGGWLMLANFGLRRRARLEETPMPGFPSMSVACLVVFVVGLALSISKIVDDETLRGTIVAKKVEALSSPEASATPLFDLYEGLEVIVRETHGEWVQVNYPGGSTGWIPKATLVTTSEG